MKTCPHCSHPLGSGPFCTGCGKKVDPSTAPSPVDLHDETRLRRPVAESAPTRGVFCPDCHTYHTITTKFCPETGAHLARQQPPAPLDLRRHPTPPPLELPGDEEEVPEPPTRELDRGPAKPSPPTPDRKGDTDVWVKRASHTRAALHVERDGRETEVIEVHQAIDVGRGTDCDIDFAGDDTVSPRHARFFYQGKSLCVEDVGSLNGVFVRIRHRVMLADRDRIRLGKHIFRFEVVRRSEEDEKEATKILMERGTRVLGTEGERATARLIIRLDTGLRGKEYFIGTRAVTIGRGGATFNFMSDDWISSVHAKITPREKEEYWLEDLGSETGTWKQVRGYSYLVTGDEILIGMQKIRVEYRE